MDCKGNLNLVRVLDIDFKEFQLAGSAWNLVSAGSPRAMSPGDLFFLNGIGVSDTALRPCCENCREFKGFGLGRCNSLRPFTISLKLLFENCTQYTGIVTQCCKIDRLCACHVAKMMNGIGFSPEIEGTPARRVTAAIGSNLFDMSVCTRSLGQKQRLL